MTLDDLGKCGLMGSVKLQEEQMKQKHPGLWSDSVNHYCKMHCVLGWVLHCETWVPENLLMTWKPWEQMVH